VTAFGAFLDSVIDRYSDLVILLGIVVLFARTPNARGALVGIAACVVFTAWATFTSVKLPALNRELIDLGPFNYRLHPFLIGIFNHIIVFVVGLAASLWFARNSASTAMAGMVRETEGVK